MSILLDALRKSEQNQRRGAVPTLDTELPPAPAARRLPGWLPWALLGLLVTAVVAAWLWMSAGGEPLAGPGPAADRSSADQAAPAQARTEQSTPEQGSPEQAAAPTASAERPAGATPAKDAPAVAEGLSAAGGPAAQPVAGDAETAAMHPASPSAAGPRTPVERALPPVEPPVATPAQSVANAEDDLDEPPAGSEPGASLPASAGVTMGLAGERRDIPDPVAALEGDEASGTGAAAADAAPGRTSATGAYEAEPVGFWALPQDVRARLPEFRISVLVYAARPEDRFALVNGRRLGEGDRLATGLELVEIRRDGAVFTFERYRFLVGR